MFVEEEEEAEAAVRILSHHPPQQRQQSGAPSSRCRSVSADSVFQLSSGSSLLFSTGEPIFSSLVAARFCSGTSDLFAILIFRFPTILVSSPLCEAEVSPGGWLLSPGPSALSSRGALRLRPHVHSLLGTSPPPSKLPFVSAEDGG